MSIESDVAETAVKAILSPASEIGEMSVKLAGSGAVKLAALLYALYREGKSVNKAGIAKMSEIVKDSGPPKIVTIPANELKEFSNLAQQYGVSFAVIRSKTDRENVQAAFKADAVPSVNLILETMGYGLTEKSKKKTESPRENRSGERKRSSSTPRVGTKTEGRDLLVKMFSDLNGEAERKEGRGSLVKRLNELTASSEASGNKLPQIHQKDRR